MNIYITKDNEQFLKSIKTNESMSGVINKLLDDYRAGKGADLFPPKSVKAKTIAKPSWTTDTDECPRHHVSYDLCKSKH